MQTIVNPVDSEQKELVVDPGKELVRIRVNKKTHRVWNEPETEDQVTILIEPREKAMVAG